MVGWGGGSEQAGNTGHLIKGAGSMGAYGREEHIHHLLGGGGLRWGGGGWWNISHLLVM